jgi:hypothetical protein
MKPPPGGRIFFSYTKLIVCCILFYRTIEISIKSIVAISSLKSHRKTIAKGIIGGRLICVMQLVIYSLFYEVSHIFDFQNNTVNRPSDP